MCFSCLNEKETEARLLEVRLNQDLLVLDEAELQDEPNQEGQDQHHSYHHTGDKICSCSIIGWSFKKHPHTPPHTQTPLDLPQPLYPCKHESPQKCEIGQLKKLLHFLGILKNRGQN